MCIYLKNIYTCSEEIENQAINAFLTRGAFPAPSFELLTTKPPTPVFPLTSLDRT